MAMKDWKELDTNFIKKKYIDEEYSCEDIGKMLKVSRGTIENRLKSMNIERRKIPSNRSREKSRIKTLEQFKNGMPEETKVKLRMKKPYIRDEKHRKDMSEIISKRVITEEHCKNISKGKKGKPNPKHSETLKRMIKEGKLDFTANLGDHTKLKYDYSEMVECACGCGAIFQKHKYGRDRRYVLGHQMKETRKFIKTPSKDTSIEIKMQNFLKKLGIEFYTHQYMKEIEHGYQCDILVPVQRGVNQKTIIECDGDYWHKYPEGREIDRTRDKELKEQGFRVVRLWEHEIRKMRLNNLKGVILQNA